ncbi:hypothetical protein scyTo_0017970 [Scyliorhinus torazame]|uniref:TMEM181 GOLD domain-containing protein n=1 Tax=Scyliorhinus torazame TaxID=75743 RepID=A0A401Q3F3_SCYTO|nr:hypothetical protein [Scyliorhinus torazame]
MHCPEIITSRALPPISTKSKDSLTSPLKLQTPGLSTYNQELWLMCRFELNKSAAILDISDGLKNCKQTDVK